VTFPLTSEKLVVGRSRSCDIRIKEDSVSRLHAALVWHDDQLVIEDLGSSNGTFVNGARVLSPHVLRAGDVLRFGALRGNVERCDEPPPSAESLARSDVIDYTVGIIHGEPATLGWRVLALLTDLVLFSAGLLVTFGPALAVMFVEGHLLSPEALPPRPEIKSLILGGCGALTVIFAWYYVVHGWARRGGTPGLRLCGLRLLDFRRRTPIGYRRAIVRLLACLLTLASLGLGFLLIPLRRDRKALHDVLAGTTVAHKSPTLGGAGLAA
jgi:uncharacterized RDD family membrane protein YckC